MWTILVLTLTTKTKKALDRLPAFTLADQHARPLAYTEPQPQPHTPQLALFYTDGQTPRAMLRKMRREQPELQLTIIATPLGDAYQNVLQNTARLVPSAHAEKAAAATLDANRDWALGETPLFGCYQMQMPGADSGEPTTPLFFAEADASRALRRADPANKLAMACVSLERIVEMIEQGRTESAIQFVPSSSAIRLCAEIESGEATADSLAAAVPPSTVKRALPDLFDGGGVRGGGIFPGL